MKLENFVFVITFVKYNIGLIKFRKKGFHVPRNNVALLLLFYGHIREFSVEK